MSAETKGRIAKLNKSRIKIGYPDKWKDSALTIKVHKKEEAILQMH
jgi:predicted metalloendopeptidase